MALFPRRSRDGSTTLRPLHPQVQERLTAMDEDRLEGFGFKEFGRFTQRTIRATPEQHFLRGAPVIEADYNEVADIIPLPTGEDEG